MTDSSGEVIYEKKWITLARPFCEERVNPGTNPPQAPGRGQSEDGFYFMEPEPRDVGFEVEVFATAAEHR
jgi:hypothetical protein